MYILVFHVDLYFSVTDDYIQVTAVDKYLYISYLRNTCVQEWAYESTTKRLNTSLNPIISPVVCFVLIQNPIEKGCGYYLVQDIFDSCYGRWRAWQ